MASRKRSLYCLGVMTVGPPAFDAPPRKVVSLTQLSMRLSQV